MNQLRNIDWDNLPERSELEDFVSSMDAEEVLSNLNDARARILKMDGQIPEDEAYAGILVVRRFRFLRETNA